ncbi:MAG: glycosyltransferase family 4 protein [Firmicutes bacterium]|nr:glycosyltransferase family 4 protein [Bacillota bacterium]
MKIAIEARPVKWSYGTGIGNYTHSLIKELDALDHKNEYTFLCPDNQPQDYLPFSRDYTYYSLPKDDQREEVEIPDWLAIEKVDLFHLPQNGFRIPKRCSCKLVVTVHDLIPYFLPEMVRSSFLKRFTTEMPFIVERADRIITVSAASKQDIINIFKVDPQKITVIPSAPSSAYRPLPKAETKDRLWKTYGLKKPYILYVGGLNPRKNVAELIYAYSKIRRLLPEGQSLVILGPEGRHRSKLQLLGEALNLTAEELIFPGFIDTSELPYFYNGADLFVYPSLYEGFGLPPIEAMACGIPVITSDVSSMPEVVGDAAVKVNPYDTLALAEAILKVLTVDSLRLELSAKGLRHSAKYTWNKIANQVLQVYQELISYSPVV